MSVVDKICHYQRNLQKCGDDETRILHCISKLYNLPVTVQHLQETGVGRTVNSFRKYDGTVGDAAKALVFKWKIMVADAESTDDEDETCPLDVHENNTESHESKIEDVKEYISSLEPSTESKHGHKYKEIKSESIAKQNTIHPSKSRLEEKHEKKHSSKHSQNERRSSEKSSKKKEEGQSSTKHNSSRNNDMKRNSEKTIEISENSSRKRKADSSSSSSKESKKRKGSESKSDDEKSQVSVSEKNHSRSKSSGFQIEVKIKVKDEPFDKSKQDAKQDKYSQERSKSSSSKSKSIESSGKEKESGERQKHKREEYVSRDKKHEARKDSSHHSSKETSKSKVSSSSDKDHLKNKNKDKKKEQKEEKSKQEKKKETRVKLMQEINGDEGIDCNSGTSFAEALGMCTMPQPSKKRHINSSNTSLNKSIKMESMSPPINSKKTPTVKETVKETESSNISNPPSLLAPNVKLEPLNVDLASTLPEISPNYKPLPYINPVHRREEVKLIDDIIYVKNQRTKVYSGNKGGYTSVPTLYDICIRVLIENIDALEYTGGVPYDILKPVLERATPDQLYMLEHYNSYLVEDTDTLWKYHCNREFRNKERQEMESWREMYMRCLDEREAKLKTLTENIKQSIDKSVPVRSTKLAYVDNVVKPPRNIMKKQAKYGTANATPSTISSVKKKLTAGGAVNNATNIAVPPPPMARFKASTSNSMKKTKAPLMAKALQLIKGRYKR